MKLKDPEFVLYESNSQVLFFRETLKWSIFYAKNVRFVLKEAGLELLTKWSFCISFSSGWKATGVYHSSLALLQCWLPNYLNTYNALKILFILSLSYQWIV